MHAISWLKKQGYKPVEVCCVYPTSPLLQIKDLKTSLKDLRSGKWEYVFSATSFSSSIYRSFTKNKKRKLKIVFPRKIHKRSQDLEQTYHDAGQFYWGMARTWLKKKEIFRKDSKIFLLPNWRVQDIDIIDDWKNISALIPSKFKKNVSLKKSGFCGIFSASLELTREGIISIIQKKKFGDVLIKEKK